MNALLDTLDEQVAKAFREARTTEELRALVARIAAQASLYRTLSPELQERFVTTVINVHAMHARAGRAIQ